MNIEVHFQRAQLLLEQSRYAQAADELRQILSQDPNHGMAHALLAICFLNNKDMLHEATREAQQAIGIEPDNAFSHYVLALICNQRNQFPEALNSIDTALSLDAGDARYYGVKASILARQERWAQAVEAAEEGLALDAEDDVCASMRSIALERLGKVSDALDQATQSVARRPDSSDAHSTRGWALLHQGNYREAEIAFREALRLQPTNEMARIGMIQTLNNHHLLFRLVFRFYTFVGRMAQGAQWAIIIGLFVGMRLLRAFADANPEWQPYVMPISILYVAFCLLSWIATPLFNTFLRFHPFGKYLLSDKEKWASNIIAGLCAVGVLGALLQVTRGDFGGAVLMFIAPVFLCLPINSAFSVDAGWPRYTSIAFSIVLGILALTSIVLIAVDGPWPLSLAPYAIGILVFSFLGNYLARVTVRR